MSTALSKYKIQKVLGEGGMGKVYLAFDSQSGQKLAIKELFPEQAGDPNIRKRFQREAKALSALNHPNIVKFYEFMEHDNSAFLVMEYAEGQSLDSYITKVSGPIPEAKAIDIMAQILLAFSYAHDKGIVHRDIKPNNIIISPTMGVKILDFGIAKIERDSDAKLTQVGTILGTSCYMSPEQAQGLSIDHRTDIYSLGILLFHVITGKPPYDIHAVSDIDIRINIIRNPLPQVKDVYGNVSDHIQKVIDTATNKNMTRRYQNCREFVEALTMRNLMHQEKMRTITIGRANTCDIILNDPNVSRVHAEISVAGGQYIYRDVSSNGSVVNGVRVSNDKISVAPGSRILLANAVPLPWDRVSSLLPLSNMVVEGSADYNKPQFQPAVHQAPVIPEPNNSIPREHVTSKDDKLGIGWGILAFLLPIAGWIMYFAWREDTPGRAKSAGLLGVGGFVLNLIFLFF